jgi:hypothetical protein
VEGIANRSDAGIADRITTRGAVRRFRRGEEYSGIEGHRH